MQTPHHDHAQPEETRHPRNPSGLYWAESALIKGSPVIAPNPDALLGALLTGYDPLAAPAVRLEYRRRHVVNLATVLQDRAVRGAERGELGVPWTLSDQHRVVQRLLTTSRGEPPHRFVTRWPSSQPRLVLCSHVLARGQTPAGNVLVLDAGTTRAHLDSLSAAELITWGEV